MNWKLAGLFISVLVGGLSACREQQAPQQAQQISPAVRAAVVAALGPNVSDSDMTEFLRSAKLASRTKRDSEVVAMLDEVVSLASSAAQDDYQAEKYRRDSQALGTMSEVREPCHDEEGQGGCKDLEAANDRLDKFHRDKARHSAELAQNYENESKRKREQIPELVNKLQAALN